MTTRVAGQLSPMRGNVIYEKNVIYAVRLSFETPGPLRVQAPQDEGRGWLLRFNNFGPHPEEHACAAHMRLEGWQQRHL
jgi:hypothetical protein